MMIRDRGYFFEPPCIYVALLWCCGSQSNNVRQLLWQNISKR